MYKYKKTIIINNRNRRIFSKEKSNNEYILYKNNYITLNAYNKKTSGGSLTSFKSSILNPINTTKRFLNGEKTEFRFSGKVPFYENEPVFDRKKYINNYDKTMSNHISNYLKKKSLIKDSNNLNWIITASLITNEANIESFTTVTGYNNEDLKIFIKDLNSINTLIQYGKENYLKKINEIKTWKIIVDNIPNRLYYYYLANDDGITSYEDLKNNYYIYYIITLDIKAHPSYDTVDTNDYYRGFTYVLNNTYDLFKNKILFKCDHIFRGSSSNEHGYYFYNNYIIFSYVGRDLPSATPQEQPPQEITGGKRRYRKK